MEMLKIAAELGLGPGTVQRVKKGMTSYIAGEPFSGKTAAISEMVKAHAAQAYPRMATTSLPESVWPCGQHRSI